MSERKKILITGAEGYLMGQLIEKLLKDDDIKQIIGIDIKPESQYENDEKYVYIKASITDPSLWEKLCKYHFDTIIHAAWTFNPVHDLSTQDHLDIIGTLNILDIAKAEKVKHLIYVGSTTCYVGALDKNPSEPPFLKEEDWNRHTEENKKATYRYARNKAIVDEMLQKFQEENPHINTFWVRGSIVVGPRTNNIISYITSLPFTFGKIMFRIRGHDPPMQFLSEHDMNQVLYLAYTKRWSGVVNTAAPDEIKYSEVIKLLGRKEICLPSSLLYASVWIGWQLRIIKFPPSLLNLIMYPWITDTSKLREIYGYKVKYSSREALEQFAKAKT